MQQFLIDIDKPTGPLVLYAKQADSMSRFFSVSLFSGGAEWEPPEGSALTVRFGAPGMPAGWYDTITEPDGGSHSAFSVGGNTITVELAEQAVSAPGTNTVALLINGADGYQLASWNFTLQIELVPGLEAPEATVYYNALTEQVSQTLANANAAAASADAAAQSAAQAAESAASVDPGTLVKTINGTSPTSGNVDVTKIAALQNLIAPVGYIFAWNAVDGGPDLSKAENVAAYFGFGTWQAYGTGQVLVGVDSGQTEFATPGKTGGEKTHTLSEQELPSVSPGVKYGDGKPIALDSGDTDGYKLSFTSENVAQQNIAAPFGEGQAHNNLQPYVVVYRWQRVA